VGHHGDQRLPWHVGAAGGQWQVLPALRGQRNRFVRTPVPAHPRLASTLGDAGVTALITEAQYAEGAEDVLARLAAEGLADAAARDLLGPALTPAAVDLLAVLAEP
jgi:hypothetical protein